MSLISSGALRVGLNSRRGNPRGRLEITDPGNVYGMIAPGAFVQAHPCSKPILNLIRRYMANRIPFDARSTPKLHGDLTFLRR